MDPGFNADRVQTLNNLPDDVDPYTHFLAEGQHNGAYTSYGTILRSYDENRDSYLKKYGVVLVLEKTLLCTNLTQHDHTRIINAGN